MVSVAGKLYTVSEFRAPTDETTAGYELLNGHIVKKCYWKDTENGMNPRRLNHSLAMTCTASALR